MRYVEAPGETGAPPRADLNVLNNHVYEIAAALLYIPIYLGLGAVDQAVCPCIGAFGLNIRFCRLWCAAPVGASADEGRRGWTSFRLAGCARGRLGGGV